jgi:molecular chaperone GrpE
VTDRFDDEELLDRFRRWLHDARIEAGELADADGVPPAPAVAVQEVGLFQLVEEFSALRHELKLQTKSTRGLQEQAEAHVPVLQAAIEQFRAVEPKEAQAAWSAGKPLAEALADLDEGLERGRVEIEKARRRIVDDSPRSMEAALDSLFARQSWLRRRLFRSYHEATKEVFRQQGLELRRGIFEALIEGYGLILGRLGRAMEAEQVRPIACVGKPVDPESMIVVEVVDDPNRPPGQVVEEVRRGYTWRGRVFRLAEVRAVRML